MELSCFGWTDEGGGGGGGGTIGGGGTLNYVSMFTPDGSNIGNAPIKIGDIQTRALPVNSGDNSIAIGFDTTLNSIDSYTLGRNITVSDGVGAYVIGHTVNIDDIGDPFFSGGNLFSFGSIFNVTGGINVDAIVAIGFNHSINATSQTRSVYMFGDTHTCNDFVTYSTLIGESCNFTRVDHTTAIGIFTNITDSAYIYTFGEGNTFDTDNNVVTLGNYNFITGSNNLSVFGSGNTITDSDKLYIGNNNNNMVVDALTGYVGIGITSPFARLHVAGSSNTTILGNIADNIGGWFHVATVGGGNGFVFLEAGGSTNNVSDHRVNITGGDGGHLSVYNLTGVQKIGLNGAIGASHLVVENDAQTGGLEVQFDGTTVVAQNLGVGIPIPTAKTHIVGIDNTLANYALKVEDNVLNDLFNVRNDGSVGVGVLASVGKFHTFGMISNINQRLEPVADVTEDVSGATVNTTDATTTTIQTIAIPTDKVLMIEARITARKTAGIGVGAIGDGNGYIRTATYANIGGVVTLSGAVQTSYTGEDITSFSATLTISGTNVLVRVTGAVDDDVTWNVITRTYEV